MDFKKNHTYIIAELGNIHLHKEASCRQALSDCFSAGASLVKLQCINPLTAYWASSAQHERYKKIEWSIDRFKNFFADVNAEYGNRVFASTFDDVYVDGLKDVMPYWKVAFRMRDDQKMIAKMIWSDKLIFFSTRGKFYNEDHDRYFSRSENFRPLFATEYKFDPKLLREIRGNFHIGKYSGISINFGGENAIQVAKASAPLSQFIEVHVKGLDCDHTGPDSQWSLELCELSRMKKMIDDVHVLDV